MRAAAVYAVPDPVTGDQVMAALEIGDGEFDAAAFSSFLGEQPDLGTKWAPALIRITSLLPLTATHKISKPALRRLLWNGDDPVYERTGSSYELMTADRKAELEAEYASARPGSAAAVLGASAGCEIISLAVQPFRGQGFLAKWRVSVHYRSEPSCRVAGIADARRQSLPSALS